MLPYHGQWAANFWLEVGGTWSASLFPGPRVPTSTRASQLKPLTRHHQQVASLHVEVVHRAAVAGEARESPQAESPHKIPRSPGSPQTEVQMAADGPAVLNAWLYRTSPTTPLDAQSEPLDGQCFIALPGSFQGPCEGGFHRARVAALTALVG